MLVFHILSHLWYRHYRHWITKVRRSCRGDRCTRLSRAMDAKIQGSVREEGVTNFQHSLFQDSAIAGATIRLPRVKTNKQTNIKQKPPKNKKINPEEHLKENSGLS